MFSEFVTVASFSRPVEAHLAKTKLESEGIPCFVTDEHLVQVNWLYSNAIGGVKLKVPSPYLQRARDILRPRPRLVVVASDNADIPDDELICPRCRSFDVYRRRQRVAALMAALFGLAVPWMGRKWVCKQCGYQWRDKPPVRRPTR